MKHTTRFFIAVLLLMSVYSVMADTQSDLITLNDVSPSTDVVIALPPDTTGTISLEMAMVAVTLTDISDNVVFYAADERLNGLEFNIAPNSGNHTLTIQRLPGVVEAYVRIASLSEMSIQSTVSAVDGNSLGLNQETTLNLESGNPGGTIAVNLPESTGVLTAQFPQISATSQLIDQDGRILSESTGGHVNAVRYILGSGDYGFTVLGENLSQATPVTIRTASLENAGMTLLDVPTATFSTTVNNPGTADLSFSTSTGSISEAQAIAIAQAAYPGAAVEDISQEFSYGYLVWETELNNGVELSIDVATGEILYEENENAPEAPEAEEEHEEEYEKEEYEEDDD